MVMLVQWHRQCAYDPLSLTRQYRRRRRGVVVTPAAFGVDVESTVVVAEPATPVVGKPAALGVLVHPAIIPEAENQRISDPRSRCQESSSLLPASSSVEPVTPEIINPDACVVLRRRHR